MEENEPKQRRPRTSNPAFSTPDQPTPQAKPAKAPPAVTFRPPAGDKTSSGTGTEATGATPSPRPQRNPTRSTPRKATSPTPGKATPAPPSRSRTQAAAESQQPRVEAAAEAPAVEAPAEAAGAEKPAKAQPAKATPASKATPAKRQPAAKATPGTKATPAKAAPAAAKATPAKAARPAKKAAATIKAAAAEIAPAVVEPDMSTVPDELPSAVQPPTNATPEPGSETQENATQDNATRDKGNAPSADDELMPDDFPNLAADVQEKERAGATPPATAPGQPGAVVPAVPTLPRAAAAVADTLSGFRTEAWAALIADPGHCPELLAVAATQTIGPRAKEWADRTRAAYPGVTPEALARLAGQQFTRFGSVSSIFAAVAGSYAPLALLGAAAFTHAELALHVAAAYGLDPTDRQRAVDLLVLTRVHPVRDDAEAALRAAEQHAYEHTGLTDATWRLGRMVAVQVGGWAAVRGVNHFFPGASLLVATLTSRGAARAMAARATAHYRAQSQPSQSLGSSV
jgi:hypothetical protein